MRHKHEQYIAGNVPLAVLKNIKESDKFSFTNEDKIYRFIRSQAYAETIKHLRAIADRPKREQDDYKRDSLPAVVFGARFKTIRRIEDVYEATGLMVLDFDNLLPEELSEFRLKLRQDPFIRAFFVSPRGNGLKVILHIGIQEPSEYLAYFHQASAYFTEGYKHTPDPTGKDIVRACFLSHDPEIYVNEQAEVFCLIEEFKERVKPLQEKIANLVYPDKPLDEDTRRKIIECITLLRQHNVDITSTYEDWLSVGLAFASLGEEGRLYYHEASKLHPEYSYEEADKKFSELLRNRRGEVTIGTFFHLFGRLHPNVKEVSTDWPTPVPVKSILPPVDSLEPDMLPDSLRDWIFDISFRTKCPPDFVAATVMVMLSSLIGTRLAVKPKTKDDWLVVVNLWGIIVGDPSRLKTPAVRFALKPLEELENEAREKYEQEMRKYESEKLGYDAQKKLYQSQELERRRGKAVEAPVTYPEMPNKPIQHRYITNDPTTEKMGELLNENEHGLLLYRDEMPGFLASLDKPGREQDRGFFLETWNGNGSMTVDRIGRGTLHIKHLCVSLFGCIQPAKFTGYLQAATSYENDGFVQRFQVAVYPDEPEWEYVDEYPDKMARNRAYKLIRSIAEADLTTLGYTDEYSKFPYTRFDTEGQAIFKQWLIDWQTEVLPNETGLMQEHLAKYRSLMPSLALIFHVVNCIDQSRQTKLITAEAAQMAVRWCKYLTTHARRIYGLLDTVPVEGANRIIKEIRAGTIQDGFKARDIARRGWSNLVTTANVEAALSALIDTHWLRLEEQPETGGRPEAPRYRIHPILLPKT